MLMHDLSVLTDRTPPFTTVAIDATRVDPATEDDLRLRWNVQRQHLEGEGVDAALLDLLGEEVLAPTGLGGEHARVVVASGADIALNVVLPGRPARDMAMVGPVPALMPVARAMARFIPYAVVRLDRAGADIDLVTAPDLTISHREVEGGHELLHKVPGGGWSQRRYQARVEDSWAHNAAAVAEQVDEIVRTHALEAVVVTGDERAWSELRDRLGGEASTLAQFVGSAGRAEGADEDSVHEAVSEALDRRRAAHRDEVLDTLVEQHTRQQRAVEGLEPVVDALRRGQVEHVVLRDDPSSTRTLWVGEGPLVLGATREDAREAGAEEPVEVRADTALVWAMVGSRADLVLTEDSPVELIEGIGAVLRWSDEATTHDLAPSMPGHGEAPGGTG